MGVNGITKACRNNPATPGGDGNVQPRERGNRRPSGRGGKVNANKPLYCFGCEQQSEVDNLIAMAGAMFICNECVELLHDIEQKNRKEKPAIR
jgi:hypothetical protein